MNQFYALFIALVSSVVLYGQTCTNCNTSFDGGVIATNQSGYNPYDANILTSTNGANSGASNVEYIWMFSHFNMPNTPGNIYWSPVPNSNSATLDPGTLTQTTYFIRCARIVGCQQYLGESNVVTITVTEDPCTQAFDGGIIAADQSGFNPYDANDLTSVQDATNPNGAVEYVWMMSTQNVPNTPGNGIWSPVPNSNSSTIDLGTLSQTTHYVRCTRLVGCSNYWGESNVVTITVNDPQPVTQCLVYAVHDEGQFDHSQLFTIDPFNNNAISALGQPHVGLDLEGLEIHPITGMLYGTSGNDNTAGLNGHFYRIDAVTGDVYPVGPTGFDDVVSLAFHPITNTLYAWCDDYGLLTIDLATGAGTLVISSPADMDGLAFDPTGNNLYGVDDNELYLINLATNSITFIAGGFGGTIESLEARPDGLLYFGIHGSGTTSLYAYDPINLIAVSQEDIQTTYHDVEGIAWPDGCSFIIDGQASYAEILCTSDLTDIDVTMLQGTAPYSCVWSTGETTEDLTQVSAGTYTVNVTDANGLVYTETITITEPAPLDLVFNNQNPSTAFTNDGMIDLAITGGTPAYVAEWDNGNLGTYQAFLGTGTYHVTITDSNGCTTTGTTTLTCGGNLNTNLDFSAQVSIYPQPAFVTDLISVVISTPEVELINLRVLDLNGNVVQVLNEIETLGADQLNNPIRIQDLATGVYLLEMNNGKTIQTERIVVR